MQYAQALFGPLPAGDPLLIDRAYDALIRELEKTRFAATTRPRSRPGRAIGIRTIPNHVKRAVWERDGGQCTFVSEGGRRCPARKWLEYDHEVPVARGGAATVENLHLKCRAHNQYAAEQAFGAEFMSRKREARRARGDRHNMPRDMSSRPRRANWFRNQLGGRRPPRSRLASGHRSRPRSGPRRGT
ncbi:MAG TPA: HNH endonuclease signature motif containing protein [Candidatus Eisenbacteria bacterium]|jgi:hypothetical protein